MQNAKFRRGEWVHMSVIANGSRSKGVFKIYAPVYNPAGWVDYQLIDPYTNQLHNRGAAVRERDLKAGQ
ncbi:hypothetical protein SVAN01_03740 [Stagonosporopsis vannaccii]|nr:hypothetical protein SVAN01_03740 [Stagonosporopsis vannaccii]